MRWKCVCVCVYEQNLQTSIIASGFNQGPRLVCLLQLDQQQPEPTCEIWGRSHGRCGAVATFNPL